MPVVKRDQLFILGVNFDEQGAVIHYGQHPHDVRVGGQVALQHACRIENSHPDYREDLDDLHRACQRVLANALEDWEGSEPLLPETDEATDDDERGMGE